MKDLNREEEKRRKWRKIFVGRRREKEKKKKKGKMGNRSGLKTEAGPGESGGRGKREEAGREGKEKRYS